MTADELLQVIAEFQRELYPGNATYRVHQAQIRAMLAFVKYMEENARDAKQS